MSYYVVHNIIPHVDDIISFPDGENGWCVKVVSVSTDENYMIAECEPFEFDDITDIFQQFITVEEYGYDDAGNLARRRVAGRPDLTIGKSPKKAQGQWEGDIFNFSLSGHIPLYDNDLTITIDPTVEGKLHLKTVWKLSWFGDKYISILTKLNMGVGAGFSIDGKIKDFFPGGVGGLVGGVPVPATCPLIYLDITPDAFLRGEAHVKFTAKTPKLQGAIWSKLEIKNWVPSMDAGFGNSDDGSQFEYVDNSSAGTTLSLNGYIQAGMLFPLKFKSLPLIKNFFNAEIGVHWYVGPKVSADFTLDLTTMPWDDVATYNQLKNITLGLHLLDADFEAKGTVQTAFSGKKEVTLAEGSFNLFPPLDTKFVPEFGGCVEYVEDRMISGELKKCRVYAFEPLGNVFKPVYIGTYLYQVNEDDSERLLVGNYQSGLYYNISRNLGQEYPRRLWAEYVIPITPGVVKVGDRGSYRLRPHVSVWRNREAFVAPSEYDFQYGICEATPSADTIFVNCDGTVQQPITIKGTSEKLRVFEEHGSYYIGDGSNDDNDFQATGSNGNLIVTPKNPENFNCNPREKLVYTWRYRGETTTEYGEIFYSDERLLTICYLPNTCKEPVWGSSSVFPPDASANLKWTFSRIGNDGWHFVGTYKDHKSDYKIEFDFVADDNWKDDVFIGSGECYNSGGVSHMKFNNVTIDASIIENGNTTVDIHEAFTDKDAHFSIGDDYYSYKTGGIYWVGVIFPK